MAEYMKKAFGEKLLSDFIDGDPNRQQLPSPEVIFLAIAVMISTQTN